MQVTQQPRLPALSEQCITGRLPERGTITETGQAQYYHPDFYQRQQDASADVMSLRGEINAAAHDIVANNPDAFGGISESQVAQMLAAVLYDELFRATELDDAQNIMASDPNSPWAQATGAKDVSLGIGQIKVAANREAVRSALRSLGIDPTGLSDNELRALVATNDRVSLAVMAEILRRMYNDPDVAKATKCLPNYPDRVLFAVSMYHSTRNRIDVRAREIMNTNHLKRLAQLLSGVNPPPLDAQIICPPPPPVKPRPKCP